MKQECTFRYQGTITAKSEISTCPPETPDGRNGIKGLPRMNGRIYFPSSGFRGKARRVACKEIYDALARRNGGEKAVLSSEDFFYLELGGILEGTNVNDAAHISVEDYAILREKNPLIALFGSGKPFQEGKLGIGHLLPETAIEPVEIRSVRTNPFQRSHENIDYIRRNEVDRLILRLQRDGENSRVKKEMLDIRRNITALEGESRASASNEHKRLKSQIEGQVAISLPNIGHEAIPPGTVMNQSITLRGVTDIEHGFFISMLRNLSAFPYIGAHFKDNGGEIYASYRVFRIDGPTREEVGEVQVGFGEYKCSGDPLVKSYETWKEASASIEKFDFRAPSAILPEINGVVAKAQKM
jgi:hypothetical protein